MRKSDNSLPDNISEIVSLLKSDFTPQTEEDFERLLGLSKIPNQRIQSLILRAIERSETDLGMPIVVNIAMCGVNHATRKTALDSLSFTEDQDVLEAFLACAHDENVENQLLALRRLKGQLDDQVINLLIDKIQHPEIALPANEMSRQEDIRPVAVESLSISGANQAVKPLVELVRSNENLRIKARQSITTIGTLDAVETLLRICEGTDEDFPDPDQTLRMELIIAIAEMKHHRFAQGQLERYRKLLTDLLTETEENPTYRRKIIAEIILRLDDQLCNSLIAVFEKHSDDQTGTEIIQEMANAKLSKSKPFWKKAFEHWHPTNQDHIKTGFQQTAHSNTKEALVFLEEAIHSESRINQPDRLPQIYGNLSKNIGQPIVKVFCKHLDKVSVRNNSKSYLDQIWLQISPENKAKMLKSLTLKKYQETETIDFIAGFLSPRWNEKIGDEQTTISVLDALFLHWKEEKTFRDQISKIIKSIISKLSNNSDLVARICVQARNTDLDSEGWDLIYDCMKEVDRSLMFEELKSTLEEQWHKKLVETLIKLNGPYAIKILRLHLIGSDTVDELAGDDRVWAIEKIGEVGSTEDYDFLRKEIEGEIIETANAATTAVWRIDPNTGQVILRETVESRKKGVVYRSLEGLEAIDEILPETIAALRYRVDNERDRELKQKASEVLETILNKHIKQQPDTLQDLGSIQKWLQTLAAFPASEISGKALEKMLYELGDRESSEIRLALANAVETCCPAELGIALSEKELRTERRPEVVSAWENALDTLKGLPDRGVLNLIERICQVDIDRENVFKGMSLDEIFLKPKITLPALSDGLRGVERVLSDPDATAERLDSTAELLIDELLWFAGEEPEQFDTYANKIGRSKKYNLPAMRHADHLHNIREQIIGPHSKDKSGQLRKGIGAKEAEDAKRAFSELFQEVIIYLRGT